MCKKVIFLDVDGVLNSGQNQQENEKKGVWRSEKITLDKNALQVLKTIVYLTGAYLVLSSTWRYPEYDGSFSSKENLEKQLAEHGMYLSDSTPFIEGHDRPGEILYYLNKHPEITHCVVLDDDTDIGIYDDLNSFWVPIEPQNGLQEHHITQAVNILKNEKLPEYRQFETMLKADICESHLHSHPEVKDEA